MARWQERVGEQAIQAIYERIARRELSPGQAVEEVTVHRITEK